MQINHHLFLLTLWLFTFVLWSSCFKTKEKKKAIKRKESKT